jgi:peptide methionine sulfoxide reductase msrA/msrB
LDKFISLSAFINFDVLKMKIKLKPLTKEEERVIINKGTQLPFIGKHTYNFKKGLYSCKQCGNPLYKSSDKFEAMCGWPSFDDAIEGAVIQVQEPETKRTEIICAKCKGHLGHVFTGERFTKKNTRHCVNSISLDFLPEKNVELNTAIFAAGCFWGVEYHFSKTKGVIRARAGYTGGKTKNPTYREVCSGTTGHVEAVQVQYDEEIINYEELVKLFFEIHDFTQENGQGPDIGEQYTSNIFYEDEEQKRIAQRIIKKLKEKKYDVSTKLRKAETFYEAEKHHQEYYKKKQEEPYCHVRREVF